MKPVRLLFVLALCQLVLVGCSAEPSKTITLGTAEVRVFVVDGATERSEGLQGYEPLADGTGMLFVFMDGRTHTFAMKDVSFPIDVVFIGEDLRVSAVEPLDPGDTRHVTSPGPAPFVVELPQGWAEEQGVGVGSAFDLGDAMKPGD